MQKIQLNQLLNYNIAYDGYIYYEDNYNLQRDIVSLINKEDWIHNDKGENIIDI